jgi:hypothetical protein
MTSSCWPNKSPTRPQSFEHCLQAIFKIFLCDVCTANRLDHGHRVHTCSSTGENLKSWQSTWPPARIVVSEGQGTSPTWPYGIQIMKTNYKENNSVCNAIPPNSTPFLIPILATALCASRVNVSGPLAQTATPPPNPTQFNFGP